MGDRPAGNANAASERPGRSLAALTPDYDEAAHKPYVDHLLHALKDDGIRNIALTGAYGAGKSSVLAGLKQALDTRRAENDPEPVTLSLSSLALTPDAPHTERTTEGGDGEHSQETQTNQIAKALVTQLLYVRAPSDVPDSRYLRAQPYDRTQAKWASASLGLAGTIWLSLAGWDPLTAPDLLTWDTLQALSLGLLTTGGIAGGIYGLQTLLRRNAIASVSAGGAALSLTKRSDNYLDDFLDEIVYFFQTTGTNLVIFEDLDRFDNPAIFEELRELNTVLNGAAQVTQTVRFIYAIRDSVFKRLTNAKVDTDPGDTAAYEMERANRTKFFDLVVPIVPFITHRNARDLMFQELTSVTATLGETANVPSEVIRIVARHFTDMRAIKNLCNEYQIFAHALLLNEGGVPDLEPAALFAMVAYKCLHPGDFEDILRGQSKLDTVYTDSRELIARFLTEHQTSLRRIDEHSPREHRRKDLAEQLGQQANALAELITSQSRLQLRFPGGGDDPEQITTPAFWDKLVADEPDHLLIMINGAQRATLATNSMQRIFDYQSRWPAADDSPLESREELTDKISALRAADMSDLIAWPQLIGGSETEDPFKTSMENAGLSAMAVELITAGYIDRYFGLYVGRFHETTLSRATVSYIHRHVDRASYDIHYDFKGTRNIDGLLQEVRPGALGVSAYNIQIVDHVLTQEGPFRHKLARDLSLGGETEDDFLNAYWRGGAHKEQLVGLMARHDKDILIKITDQWDLSEQQQLTLLDAALSAPDAITPRVSDAVRALLEDSYPELDAFKSQQPDKVQQRIVDLLDFPIPNLAALDKDLREHVVEADRYTLTRDNLHAARGTLQLAELPEDDAVLDRCLRDLPTYLEIARQHPGQAVIPNADDIRTLLHRLVTVDEPEWDHDSSSQLVAAVTPAAEFVDDIATHPSEFRTALVEHQRVTLSPYNLHTYLDDEHALDTSVKTWIGNRHTITEPSPTDPDSPLYVDEVAQRELAVAILNARDHIPDPRQRVNLATSIADDAIDAETVTPEDGELLALLLEKNALSSEETAVRHFLTECRWSAIAAAAQHLEDPQILTRAVTDGTVPTDEIPDVLDSNLPDTVLAEILEALPDLVPQADAPSQAVYQAAARTALALRDREPTQHTSRWLTSKHFARFIAAGVSTETIVTLIPDAATADGDLRGILKSLPPPYAELADPGTKVRLPDDAIHTRLSAHLHKQRLLKGPGQRSRTRKTRGTFEVQVR